MHLCSKLCLGESSIILRITCELYLISCVWAGIWMFSSRESSVVILDAETQQSARLLYSHVRCDPLNNPSHIAGLP